MVKSRSRIRLKGKHHNMAREAMPFFDKLNSLDYVINVGIGKFRERNGKGETGVRVCRYNPQDGSYKLELIIKRFPKTSLSMQ